MLAITLLAALALSAAGHALLLGASRPQASAPSHDGLPVALAITVVVAVAAVLGHRLPAGVALGALGYAAVGLVQERRVLAAGSRTLSLSILGAGAVLLTVLTDGPASWGLVHWALLTVLGAACLVAYAAVLKDLDSTRDGAAPMSAVLLGLVVAMLATHRHDVTLAVAGLALAGAAGGLLGWNAAGHRVLLGTAGSYGLGALGPLLLLDSWLRGTSLLACAGPVLLFAADAVWTAVRRVRRGDAWHTGRGDHVRERMVDLGVRQVVSAVVATGFAAVVAGLVVLGSGAGLLGVPLLFVAAAVLGVYLGLPEITAHIETTAEWAAHAEPLDLHPR